MAEKVSEEDPKKKIKAEKTNFPFSFLDALAVLISFFAFIVSINGYNLSKDTLETTKEFEAIRMIKELSDNFNTEQKFLDVRTAIESCKPLYKSWGGPYTHDTLNIYLGFFEKLAFLHKENMLKLKMINYFFGAYLVEASVHPHIIRYIKGFHEHHQPEAFIDFEALSQKLTESFPARKSLADSYRKACSKLEG